MSLLELIFLLPKNDRVLSFKNVTEATNLRLDQVEHLVMKAMSLELIKGSINQVEQVVKVTWIVPRVLDNARIKVMKDKIEAWNKGLDVLIKTIEKEENKMIIE